MVVKHNLSAINNERCLSVVTGREAKRSEKLSSGYRINRAADDAAGLSISEKMRRQIRGLTQASANAQDGISLLQSAEGALHEVHHMLHRMNELAVQAANGINSEEDRAYLQEEVAQIITEVDRVATTTKFNETYLLNGSYGKKTKGANVVNPNISIREVVVYKAVTTDQTEDPFWEAQAGNDAIKDMLENQIVPQAVSSLVNTFNHTFGYLDGSDIGIGLYLYDNANDTAVAYVASSADYWNQYSPPKVELNFRLGVNMAMIGGNIATGAITDAGRRYLESTIAHEMMHAMMFESLTAGMLGKDQNMNNATGFPSWFAEGTAQAAGGGIGWVRSGLRVNENSTPEAIQAALNTHRLGSGSTASEYATGYLAVMFLGYLVNGGNSIAAADVARGVDLLLNEIRGGKSLDQAIADNTQYAGLTDFEARFAADGASFSKDLIAESALSITDYGRGALVTGNYQDVDLLEDVDAPETVFNLNPDYTWINNVYPNGYTVMSGGMATQTGVVGPDYVAAPGNGGTGGNTGTTTPGGNTGTTTPGGNTGGTGGTGGTPGTGGGNTGGTTGGGTIGTAGSGSAYGSGLSLQIGSEAGHNMVIYIEAMNAAQLGIEQVDISTEEGALDAISMVGEAIHRVSAQRSALGAYHNRLEHTIRNLDNVVENTQAAESQIRDADMAKEMLEFSNLRILRQAGQAILAQTRQYNQGVLALLA